MSILLCAAPGKWVYALYTGNGAVVVLPCSVCGSRPSFSLIVAIHYLEYSTFSHWQKDKWYSVQVLSSNNDH